MRAASTRAGSKGAEWVGITAGASAPEELVQDLIAQLRDFDETEVSVLDGIRENVQFKLPAELRDEAVA